MTRFGPARPEEGLRPQILQGPRKCDPSPSPSLDFVIVSFHAYIIIYIFAVSYE